MNLYIKKKKIKVQELDTWLLKIKSFKFKLDNIEEGICFPKKES